ncbi:unnamed protein product [Durusdinium trenchii]|uniref:EH domain-containing protein n=2 Tax=Durusdinium trenchii TaxID=1381693 RepID=A0ABP0P2W6_9DINO
MSFHAAELELYGDYYARLGGEGITVDVLAPFLAQSGLPRETLSEIWSLTFGEVFSSVDFDRFCAALRLVAHAQAGAGVSPVLLEQEPLYPPTFEAADTFGDVQGGHLDTENQLYEGYFHQANSTAWDADGSAPTSFGTAEQMEWPADPPDPFQTQAQLSEAQLPEAQLSEAQLPKARLEEQDDPFATRKLEIETESRASKDKDDEMHSKELDFAVEDFSPALPVAPPQPIEHLIAVMEHETWLLKRLRLDDDERNEEILRLEKACREEEKALAKTKGEIQQSNTERRHLQQQLDTSQNQLVELRMEYDMLRRESVFLQHDQSSHAAEVLFLQRLLEEYQRDSKVLERSISLLGNATFGLEGQSRALQQATLNLEQQANAEAMGLEKDMLELQAVRQALDSMTTAGLPGSQSGGGSSHHWSSGGMSLFDTKPLSFERGVPKLIREGV